VRGHRLDRFGRPRLARLCNRKLWNWDSGEDRTVESQLENGQLRFSVSDTGVGLPMEKMDQIFSAFFTTKPHGSGMGLAISRSIVESHGGQLWAIANLEGRNFSFHTANSRHGVIAVGCLKPHSAKRGLVTRVM
jgi:signal transduction histidine kinase